MPGRRLNSSSPSSSLQPSSGRTLRTISSLRISLRLPCSVRGRRRLSRQRSTYPISTKSQTEGTFCSRAINDVAVLGNDDLSSADKPSRGRARSFHQRLPFFAFFAPRHATRRLAGANGLARAAFREQAEDCCFERLIFVAHFAAPAAIAAELYLVPVLRPALAPLHRASTCSAGLRWNAGCFAFRCAVRQGLFSIL